MRPVCRQLFCISAAIVIAACSFTAKAQFREEAFTQSYTDQADSTARDSTDVMFSFKEYFGGLRHTREARIGVVMGGSAFMVGGAQIYNRQYWKLPAVYGGIAAGVGGGIYYRQKWRREGTSELRRNSDLCFIGAGLVWWGSLMDGTVNYRKGDKANAGKATLYSLLLPGLGQAYNGEYWKIPIYYGCILGSVHFYSVNRKNYQRFKNIYDKATDPDVPYDGPVQESTAKYYRDSYRRYRDYSVLAIAGFYLLQAIDANIFSYMGDFDISDDITMNVGPAVITDGQAYAEDPFAYACNVSVPAAPGNGYLGMGLRLGLRF